MWYDLVENQPCSEHSWTHNFLARCAEYKWLLPEFPWNWNPNMFPLLYFWGHVILPDHKDNFLIFHTLRQGPMINGFWLGASQSFENTIKSICYLNGEETDDVVRNFRNKA